MSHNILSCLKIIVLFALFLSLFKSHVFKVMSVRWNLAVFVVSVRDSPNFLKCQMSLKVTYGGKERTVFTGNCSQDNLYRYDYSAKSILY